MKLSVSPNGHLPLDFRVDVLHAKVTKQGCDRFFCELVVEVIGSIDGAVLRRLITLARLTVVTGQTGWDPPCAPCSDW